MLDFFEYLKGIHVEEEQIWSLWLQVEMQPKE